jgi:hypothetical protein
MPEISVLLPTVRPHLAQRAFDSIAAAVTTVPYEVIVVADFGPEEWDHCAWIVRERKGVIDAVNIAVAEARGEYLFLFNDESTLDPRALDLLHAEALFTPRCILTPKHIPAFGFAYYGLPFVPFPFASRRLFEEIGGLLDPAYGAFYADPDLGMRAHAHRIPMRIVEEAVIRHNNQHDEVHSASVGAYLAADRATFRTRWDHLGEFADP